jgi:hypothetical protein
MLQAESQAPKQWYYVSFSHEKFLGGAFLEAQGPATLLRRTHELGINPGGQTLSTLVPEDELCTMLPPPEMRNRLLSLAELEALFPMQKWVVADA